MKYLTRFLFIFAAVLFLLAARSSITQATTLAQNLIPLVAVSDISPTTTSVLKTVSAVDLSRAKDVHSYQIFHASTVVTSTKIYTVPFLVSDYDDIVFQVSSDAYTNVTGAIDDATVTVYASIVNNATGKMVPVKIEPLATSPFGTVSETRITEVTEYGVYRVPGTFGYISFSLTTTNAATNATKYIDVFKNPLK